MAWTRAQARAKQQTQQSASYPILDDPSQQISPSEDTKTSESIETLEDPEIPGNAKTPTDTETSENTETFENPETPDNIEEPENLAMPENPVTPVNTTTPMPANADSVPSPVVQKADDRLYSLYSFLSRDEYLARVRSVERLLDTGSEGWEIELPQIQREYQSLRVRLVPWIISFVNENVKDLSDENMNLIIASLEGYCVKKDWATLKEQVPHVAYARLGALFAEALINKFIMEKIFSNPFWYLDGKSGLKDPREDESFSTKLHYLYHRFFNRIAQTNGDLSFGQENADRLKARAPFLVDEILASEPLCLLLKKPLEEAKVSLRRNHLIIFFEQASDMMHLCEAYLGGHFEIQHLPELGSSYKCDSDYMTYLAYGQESSSDVSTFDGCEILLVVRPGIVYSHTVPGIASDYDSISNIVEKATVLLAERNEAMQSTGKRKADSLEQHLTADIGEGRVDPKPKALKQTHLGATASGRKVLVRTGLDA
ncbi:hypothetical protein AbraCBS73388_010052 [Aspergillus brasiliensis]|uniref:Uncharacterized protein n=1 Tax=Aspergillus brasiliensis TaxID=319629 RepID=A0A9W6DIG1_9EURO|nr:hypothetical protein AbraCBS73388_010052 [Aspergillus brasiliensis]